MEDSYVKEESTVLVKDSRIMQDASRMINAFCCDSLAKPSRGKFV